MLFIILIACIAILAYVGNNVGEDRRRDGASQGWKPVITVLIVALVCWLIWPVIGPFADWFVAPITAAYHK
jgi:Na+-driven multidrug efflux pump